MTAGEIKKKIRELQELAEKENLDIGTDLNKLQAKLEGKENREEVGPGDAWHRVQLARHPDRPTTLKYVELLSEQYLELHGDRAYADDSALVGGICTIDGTPYTFLGHQKGKNMKENLHRNYGMAHPEGYRKALRLAKQAERFGRPILALIDTPGAFPGVSAEERGIGEAIARNLREFSTLQTPIIVVVIGEGGSGGALGIGVGDKVYMLENTIYSVISPEGFASILLRDAKKAQQAAELMRLTSTDLKGFGVVDGIIPEPPGGAHKDPQRMADRIRKEVTETYRILSKKRMDQLLRERSTKLLSLGVYFERTERKGFFGRRKR